MDICETEQISLSSIHLPRDKNQAADSLAKSNIERFKAIIPNSFENPKKVKKVEFCQPLPDDETRMETGTFEYRSLSLENLSNSMKRRLLRKALRKNQKTKSKQKQSEAYCSETEDSSENKSGSS